MKFVDILALDLEAKSHQLIRRIELLKGKKPFADGHYFAMDFSGQEGEEEMHALIREGGAGDSGAGDGSEFPNKSSVGMEVE
jgi:hypothetical protein